MWGGGHDREGALDSVSLINELMNRPGVRAVGEYAFRGDRFSHRGGLSEEHARVASIMCRATTLAMTMQADMIAEVTAGQTILPVRGWMMRTDRHTICVVANVFCLMDNGEGDVDAILATMQAALADVPMDLV